MKMRLILTALVLGSLSSSCQVKETKKLDLMLTLKTRAGYEAVVERPFDLVFVLRNQGATDFVFSTYSCQTVHEANYSVTEPNGSELLGLGRILVGGPHCFCRVVTNVVLKAHQEIELPTSTTNADNVGVWIPTKTGVHRIVGHYELPALSSRPVVISSVPISIDVVRQKGKPGAANKMAKDTARKLTDSRH